MKRHYLPADFTVTDWESLHHFYKELSERTLPNASALEKWMHDVSELQAVVSEDAGWRYIKMTCNTQDKALLDAYTYFVTEIDPHIAPYTNDLNKKLYDSPYLNGLDPKHYFVYLRSIKRSIELFRQENIALFTELHQKEQEFGAISGAQTITYNGEEMTLQKAATFLKSQDRALRESVYRLMQERRAKDEAALNELYSELIRLRQDIAINTGYSNYRDYKHDELGRFDYSVKDCFLFHDAIRQHIVPLVKANEEQRKKDLGLSDYRPWDREVDTDGKQPLQPFEGAKELISKTISCFNQLDPYFGECITTMNTMHRLDLESRIGKAPGGYNYPLYETDVPFIFMNAVGLHRDMVTMVHEGGHAIHSFLTKDLDLVDFKSTPSEVAELASMSMELISMEHWDAFFSNPEDLKRAKKEQLDKVLQGLPWIASIDKFQHWIYEHPQHTTADRYAAWMQIMKDFGTGTVNYEGLEQNLQRSWQVQLHLYEVPFYYIEYGMAQLGAIAVWRNYKNNPHQAVEQYKAALKLGYTKTIPEIYQAAGIRFDFSPAYVKELAEFVKKQYEELI